MEEIGQEASLLFQYEKFPDFYFHCGVIGHQYLDCMNRDENERECSLEKMR